MKNKILLIVFLSSFIFNSCNRDENENLTTTISTENAKNIIDLDASVTGKWVYFSFTKNEIINVSTPETDLSWDIAFSRYHIKTNGGTSGNGKGEVARLDETDFAKVISIPSNLQYKKDTLIKPVVRPGQPEQPEISLNNLVSGDINTTTGWWSYTPPSTGNQAPKTKVNNWIYIIKDAEGTPVKIQLTSYNHSQNAKSGFITFQYKKATSNNQF